LINVETLWRNYMAINIVPKKNGPYIVTGDLSELQLADADGNKYDISGKQSVALCRCGASVNKPFCDGQHSKIGFQAAEAAVKAGG
jgi:3-phenylpropionate/trans-cinnamate dioxygenase ferredoxin subunit